MEVCGVGVYVMGEAPSMPVNPTLGPQCGKGEEGEGEARGIYDDIETYDGYTCLMFHVYVLMLLVSNMMVIVFM